MEIILLKQICMMFLLILVGIFLIKKGYLSEQGSKDLGAILLKVVIPCVILKSYIVEYSRERLVELFVSAGLAAVSLGLAMLISYLFLGTRKRIENFAASFCNVGFIGIPLVQAVMGEQAVFYLAAYIALLNILQWTYGVFIMIGDRDAVKGTTFLKNPVVLAFIAAVLLFGMRVPVPQVVVSALASVGAMNTPLAMIILGGYLANMEWKELFAGRSAYLCVFLRLILIPAVTLVVFCLIPGDTKIKEVALIASCTPVGSNIAIFARQFDRDYRLSAVTVCLSTLMSIVTIPVFFMFVERFLLRV